MFVDITKQTCRMDWKVLLSFITWTHVSYETTAGDFSLSRCLFELFVHEYVVLLDQFSDRKRTVMILPT